MFFFSHGMKVFTAYKRFVSMPYNLNFHCVLCVRCPWLYKLNVYFLALHHEHFLNIALIRTKSLFFAHLPGYSSFADCKKVKRGDLLLFVDWTSALLSSRHVEIYKSAPHCFSLKTPSFRRAFGAKNLTYGGKRRLRHENSQKLCGGRGLLFMGRRSRAHALTQKGENGGFD